MSYSHRIPHSAPTGLRNYFAGFSIVILILYSIYTSKLLFTTRSAHSDCQTAVNNVTGIIHLSAAPTTSAATNLSQIAFGIAASADLWDTRKEYIKLWWRPGKTRGVVWLDRNVSISAADRAALPEIRISGNTSTMPYTHPQGQRAALRISRVVSETLRLGMSDVRWFVMGDDDTVFVLENLVDVLNKYNHSQFYYIGSSSESHIQNIFFSYAMAFGGGGFAISHPLAKELEKFQDRCIRRYPGLYGSDDRIQACMAELGVPLSREVGFHQYDVHGNLVGLLASHPVAPLVSLHHLDLLDPVFPYMTRVKALEKLFESAEMDRGSIVQQSICYDKKRNWSISVSWGYAIQIIKGVMSPREMEKPMRTFLNWYKRADFTAYAFNTRPVTRQPCQKPYHFFLDRVNYDQEGKQIIGFYSYHHDTYPHCHLKAHQPNKIKTIVVLKKPDPNRWKRSPRRDCCRVLPSRKSSVLYLWVGSCRDGEITAPL